MMLLLALWFGVAQGAIATESPPVEGERTVVVFEDVEGRPRGGETIRVVHRPGLSGEREVAIGITDALGRVHWTPEMAGVARIRAGEEQLDLHVDWPAVPLDSAVLLAVLLVAGLGAWGYGMAGRPQRTR